MPFSLHRALRDHVIPWTELPWPLDPNALFPQPAPLTLEIGFGNGEFLERAALAHPERNWLGVEISWVSLHHALRRIHKHSLTNARVAQGDGAYILRHALAPGSLDEVFVNHPDPWPKARHHRRRVVQTEFLKLLSTQLRPGGQVTVVTDHFDYGEWIAEHLEAQTDLEPAHGTTRVPELPGRIPTKYERQGREAGSTINYFVWRRPLGPADPVAVTPQRMDPMPNVILEGPLSGPQLLPDGARNSWTETHEGDTVRIHLGAAYQEQNGRDWLVDATVEEGGFRQRFALQISPRKEQRVLIKPADFGHPRPTWGVKEAVRRLAGVLIAAHPGMTLHTSGVGVVEAETGADQAP